jgi:hypothetical protein
MIAIRGGMNFRWLSEQFEIGLLCQLPHSSEICHDIAFMFLCVPHLDILLLT